MKLTALCTELFTITSLYSVIFHFIKATVMTCKICLFSFLLVLPVYSFNVIIFPKLYQTKGIKFRLLCVSSDGAKGFPKQSNRATDYGLQIGDLSIFQSLLIRFQVFSSSPILIVSMFKRPQKITSLTVEVKDEESLTFASLYVWLI